MMPNSDKPEIISRQLSKNQKPFNDDEPKFWMGGSETITEFMHALSCLFPEGEAFFVRSVKAYSSDPSVASNEKLCKQVKGFVNQEAQHSAEHAAYNRKIQQLYHHDVDKINSMLRGLFWLVEKCPLVPNKKSICLGITCSLEHLTACLAEILLTTDEGLYVLKQMSPSHRTLWIWHAIEETEHKAVAYDVYMATGAWFFARVYRHIVTTIIFSCVMVYLNVIFAIDRGSYFDVIGMLKLLYFLFGYPGFFRKFALLWFQYLTPEFHPWGYGKRGEVERATMVKVIYDWTSEMNLPKQSKAQHKKVVELGRSTTKKEPKAD